MALPGLVQRTHLRSGVCGDLRPRKYCGILFLRVAVDVHPYRLSYSLGPRGLAQRARRAFVTFLLTLPALFAGLASISMKSRAADTCAVAVAAAAAHMEYGFLRPVGHTAVMRLVLHRVVWSRGRSLVRGARRERCGLSGRSGRPLRSRVVDLGCRARRMRGGKDGGSGAGSVARARSQAGHTPAAATVAVRDQPMQAPRAGRGQARTTWAGAGADGEVRAGVQRTAVVVVAAAVEDRAAMRLWLWRYNLRCPVGFGQAGEQHGMCPAEEGSCGVEVRSGQVRQVLEGATVGVGGRLPGAQCAVRELCATGIPRAQRDGLVLGSSPARSPRRSSRASGQEKGKASKRELRASSSCGSFWAPLREAVLGVFVPPSLRQAAERELICRFIQATSGPASFPPKHPERTMEGSLSCISLPPYIVPSSLPAGCSMWRVGKRQGIEIDSPWHARTTDICRCGPDLLPSETNPSINASSRMATILIVAADSSGLAKMRAVRAQHCVCLTSRWVCNLQEQQR
ncbi:hypothetical protein KC345_g283 [Hortaea werneckii]|nr:hypothetical protein KC345_g283 [Hortaea werneckii]